jgi:hypothetical protein
VITSALRDRVVEQLQNHLSELRRKKSEGHRDYHFAHPKQAEYSRQMNTEIMSVETSIVELTKLELE